MVQGLPVLRAAVTIGIGQIKDDNDIEDITNRMFCRSLVLHSNGSPWKQRR